MAKSSLKWFYVKYSMLICLIIAVLSFVIFVTSTNPLAPIPDIIDFFLLVIGISIAIGIVVGFLVSSYVDKSIRSMAHALSEIERGKLTDVQADVAFKELATLEAAISRLISKTQAQSRLIQKKTNEYAKQKQHIFEEAIAIERGRLARELHDSVSQQLFAISMMSSALYAAAPTDDPLKQQVKKLEDMSIQAQSEMRALLLHLRPIQLEGKKLSTGINELLTELSAKQNLDVVWQIDDIEFEKGVEDHLFRILQEVISNTLRHAKASKLEIKLRRAESLAILRMIDNGIGFDTSDRKVGSYGLSTMQERAHEIGGSIKIISLKDTGTQIEVKVPLR